MTLLQKRPRLRQACLLGLLAVPCVAHAAPAKVAYLNVSDGTTSIFLAPEDDAEKGLSAIGSAVPFPAFSTAAQAPTREETKAFLLFELHKLFLPYNVIWTAERPTAGPYTMVMVGGQPQLFGFDPRVAGVALMDCADEQPSNIVFAFTTPLAGDLHGVFVTAAQETAHAFGLEHTLDPEDIMHAQLGPQQWTFPNRTSPVSAPRTCGPLAQNSHQRLLSVLGAWPSGEPKPLGDQSVPDVVPPALEILAPRSGDVVTPHVVVLARVLDESPVAEVTFETVAGTTVKAKPSAGTALSASFDLPPGPNTIVVWARDANGNQTHSSVVFEVSQTAEEPNGCTYAAQRYGKPSSSSGRLWTIFIFFLSFRTCRWARR